MPLYRAKVIHGHGHGWGYRFAEASNEAAALGAIESRLQGARVLNIRHYDISASQNPPMSVYVQMRAKHLQYDDPARNYQAAQPDPSPTAPARFGWFKEIFSARKQHG